MRHLAVLLLIVLLTAAAVMPALSDALRTGEQVLMKNVVPGMEQWYFCCEVINTGDVPAGIDPEDSAVLLTDHQGNVLYELPGPVLLPGILMPEETGWLSLLFYPFGLEDADRVDCADVRLRAVQVNGVPRRIASAGYVMPSDGSDWMNPTDVCIDLDGRTVPDGLSAAYGIYSPQGDLLYAWGGALSQLGGQAQDNGPWMTHARLPQLVLTWCRARGTVPDVVQTIVYEDDRQ